MRSISESVDIAASRRQVWNVLANLDAYKDWNPFIRSASGQLTVGSTLTLRLVPAQGRPLTFRPKVLAAEPEVLLRWIGHLIMPGIFDGTHQFELRDLDGFTRVTQSETFRGVLIPFTGGSITATKDDFRALNQALKTRVERSVAESADSSHG
jgi:hypothetical protein